MGIILYILVILNFTYALNVYQINQQAYTLIKHMKRIDHFPQVFDGRELREWIREDKFPEGRLFIDNRELREEDLLKLLENTNLEKIEEKVFVKFGWTLKRTNMRMYPSMVNIHKGNPKIDYNQYTLLEPFTPLAILHYSKDGEWFYVQAPYMRGWVKKQDVLISSREELLNIIQKPFLVVVKDKVKVGDLVFGLGSRIPYLEKRGEFYRILLPNLSSFWIRREGLEEGFLSFEEEKVKSILDSLLNTPYDWGGKEGRWDCSSLVQSLYAVFGLELPRNSAQQAQVGRVVADRFSSYEEFKDTLKDLPPYRTLIFMKGHVIIYGGLEKGDIVLYHAIHRITREDGTTLSVNSITKNYVERERLRNIYRRVISINVLD